MDFLYTSDEVGDTKIRHPPPGRALSYVGVVRDARLYMGCF